MFKKSILLYFTYLKFWIRPKYVKSYLFNIHKKKYSYVLTNFFSMLYFRNICCTILWRIMSKSCYDWHMTFKYVDNMVMLAMDDILVTNILYLIWLQNKILIARMLNYGPYCGCNPQETLLYLYITSEKGTFNCRLYLYPKFDKTSVTNLLTLSFV